MGRIIGELPGESTGRSLLFLKPQAAAEIAGNGIVIGGADRGNVVWEKLHEFLLLLQHLGMSLAEKLVNLLPPEARSEAAKHWTFVALAVLFVAAVLIITVPLLFCCVKCLVVCLINLIALLSLAILSFFGFIFYCFARAIQGIARMVSSAGSSLHRCLRGCFPCFGSSTVKMMRAPGRPGVWIPRPSFESNPAGYFQALHREV